MSNCHLVTTPAIPQKILVDNEGDEDSEHRGEVQGSHWLAFVLQHYMQA